LTLEASKKGPKHFQRLDPN